MDGFLICKSSNTLKRKNVVPQKNRKAKFPLVFKEVEVMFLSDWLQFWSIKILLLSSHFAFRTFCMAYKVTSCAKKRGVSHFVLIDKTNIGIIINIQTPLGGEGGI